MEPKHSLTEPETNENKLVGSSDENTTSAFVPEEQPTAMWRPPVAVSIITLLLCFYLIYLIFGLLTAGVYVLFGGDWDSFISPQFGYNASFLVQQVPFLAATLLVALVWMKYVDKYPISEMGFDIRGRGKGILWGIVVAVVLYILGFLLVLMGGKVKVVGINWDIVALLFSLGGFFLAAFAEEIMCRGYVFRRLMYTRMNRFVALILSSAIFSLLHFLNPHTGVIPFLNLFIAGLMLGAAYLYTRNLWFPTILHTFWNWIQGPVLGFNVSGMQGDSSLVKIKILENNLINGGEFGFEGSLLCTLLTLIATGGIILWFERKKSRQALD